jgi:hypothetical protein
MRPCSEYSRTKWSTSPSRRAASAIAIPRLALPPDLAQLKRPEPVCERGEQTAGLDLGKLSVVAN